MALVSSTVLVTAPRRLREFWSFYRRYTTTAIHTAATVALAIFGILVFLDPWFAAIAIGSYVVPPVVLYALEFEPPSPEGTSSADHNRNGETGATRDRAVEPVASTPETGRSRGGGSDTDTDTDTDSDDGDTDSDSDSDDGDTDSDSDDGDTDSDSDS
ncbi:hypothetical protein [Halopiger xanaduensis]|uniref:Uncharacterized protein n=1 Tax=Halopiger xanaduensis (strain DSM 18323 / JCM 14033 / SH-6) TaxID=797210 RepID=F8DC89_HALXS|nr:hypothetical protein [Halopiger xanaduensis]AEH37209.1 hypothetical protein Halxa_2591 [Halopiger xanaduensis SH-6]